MDGRIGVEFGDFGKDRGSFDIRRVAVLFGVKTRLCAGVDLVAHIDLRGRVFTDQNHRQAGADALCGELIGFLPETGAQLLREGVTVEDLGCHGVSGVSSQGWRESQSRLTKNPAITTEAMETVAKPPTSILGSMWSIRRWYSASVLPSERQTSSVMT